jgi:hypothetical protein
MATRIPSVRPRASLGRAASRTGGAYTASSDHELVCLLALPARSLHPSQIEIAQSSSDGGTRWIADRGRPFESIDALRANIERLLPALRSDWR